MKISVKNIGISVLLTLALGLFMTAFGQNSNSPAEYGTAPSVTGSTWVGTDSDNDYYEYTFLASGVLQYKSPSGTWTNGTWKQDGDAIWFETNHRYSEYQGNISGTHMEGRAWNIKGRKWTWVADLR
jgi:hypothetical protein